MNRHLPLLLAALALLVFAPPPTLADSNDTIRYTTRDGLAGDFVTTLALSPDSSLWVGTTEGATHISDDTWISYTAAHGLGDDWVTAIASSPNGDVWFGTQSGGISVLDPVSRTLTTFTRETSDIPSNFVTALAVDSTNRVWIGTLDKGIALYDPALNTWKGFANVPSPITAIALDSEDAPWIGTERGLYRFDGAEFEPMLLVNAPVTRIDAIQGHLYATTPDASYVYVNGKWAADDGDPPLTRATHLAGLQSGQVTAFAVDSRDRFWVGTPRGLVLAPRDNPPIPPKPLPVVLVHGWTAPPTDRLEHSEFRFLADYAARDGIPVYYASGISPRNTLYQNATVLRDEIARVKQVTGADRVNVIAFSMGGMNLRALLESSLYQGDVNRAIILGTPQAGVEVWKPILFQQMLAKPDEPSTVELAPEYARLVDSVRSPNPTVPYDLLIGDAREQTGLELVKHLPPGDGLISVASALALDGPNVRKNINADLHDFGPEPVPLELTSYLYPRDTYERYFRNALRNPDLPIGAEIAPLPKDAADESADLEPDAFISNHTPRLTAKLAPLGTVTLTVTLDENRSARFIAYYPGGEIDFTLIAPDGTRFEPSDLPRDDESSVSSLETDLASFTGYYVPDALAGDWQLVLTRTDDGKELLEANTYVELDAPLRLHARTQWDTMDLGMTNIITGYLTLEQRPELTGGELPAARFENVTLNARVAVPTDPPGGSYTLIDLPLYDDGRHADGAADDGYYGNSFTPTRTGWHPVFVTAQGDGFARETEFLFAVSSAKARLGSEVNWEFADAADGGKRLVIRTLVEAQRAGAFAISAALRKPSGEIVARQFIPLQLETGTNPVEIIFDARSALDDLALDLSLLDLSWTALVIDNVVGAAEIKR